MRSMFRKRLLGKDMTVCSVQMYVSHNAMWSILETMNRN
jgi:hypothetical protein